MPAAGYVLCLSQGPYLPALSSSISFRVGVLPSTSTFGYMHDVSSLLSKTGTAYSRV